MILIADSGSTHCNGIILKSNNTHQHFSIDGINPYYHNSEEIFKRLKANLEIQAVAKAITQIYFYGSGCSNNSLAQIVYEGLKPHFPNARIHIYHDLMASAYATYNGKPAITCIMGTGSNCIYFDGEKIQKGVSGLGYILGDEGSATHIGKAIIRGFLYEDMPKNLSDDFKNTYQLDGDMVREKVYHQPNGNVFLGSLAPFAHKHIHEAYFKNLVYDCFYDFVERQVLWFPNAKDVPIHFIGSIAFYFEKQLAEVLQNLGLEKGIVIQKPLENLIDYHLKYVDDVKHFINKKS